MLKVIKYCVILVCLSIFFTGCKTNCYDEHYVDVGESFPFQSISSDLPVELRTATTLDDVRLLIEDGYVMIGYSSFTGIYTPMSLAIDTAKEHDATLVLLDIRYRGTQKYTSIMYLPSTSTSYTYGTFNANTGSGVSDYVTGAYSGSTTTTTMNAVPVEGYRDIYTHDAMFFKKVDISKVYGIHWLVPKRLPTESIDAPIQVRILAVLHGTQAEKDGIKQGQIVKSVNDIPIKTHKDIMPFINNFGAIKKVEVEDAK